MSDPEPIELIRRIDRYLDAIPRVVARVEQIGPLSLFVNEGNGWRYYARPTPGESAFTADDVRAVNARQAELGQPREIEWVVDTAPGLADACRDAGLAVHGWSLMRLGSVMTPRELPSDVDVRLAEPDDDIATITAVADVGFATLGTDPGPAGRAEVVAAAGSVSEDIVSFTRERIASGRTVVAVATIDGFPVATGSHQPLEGVSELVGIACLPAFRRRGLGGAITDLLVRDAVERGVDSVFLSAIDDAVARVYARAGFEEIGRVGSAAPPPG